MFQVLHNAGRYLLIGALFVSLGGHFALVQTFAWGNMLMEYSHGSSVREAARKTFNGEHPCHLCKLVKESKKQEEKKPLLKAAAKMEVALPVPVRLKDPIGQAVVFIVPPYQGLDADVCLGVPLQPPREV
jgi:hypothetical protein